ncbi:hypothetical protein GOP47_0027994 [Adiantum capillus-veneris]|nr:hypothetical protein GOP47_0027622 [Adiantum capillus-veneris]KAI5057979.1 hypothetical protein GOP47_0027994 [Adiantum capillus-veneris]
MGLHLSREASYSETRVGGSRHYEAGRKLTREFSRIHDNYNTLDQVTQALRKAGLESSNLIVGVDFTKSNEWTGKKSFNGKSLHALNANAPNPYEQAISIIGRTLSPFDDDNLIPCFGFGDVTTHDRNVFSFFADHRPCDGFEDALARYKELVPQVRLAGPTSFAPIIEAAMDIVVKSDCQYHVLLIIADGQVTRSVDTDSGRLSPQEQSTIDAIVAASEFPLSIVLVGVGDGPWDMMEEFDDNIPHRAFDNFQFVNFTEIMSRSIPLQQKETAFALAALMEIPTQFRACVALQLLNRHTERVPDVDPLPPPVSRQNNSASLKYPDSSSSSWPAPHNPRSSYEQAPPSNGDLQLCPVCWVNPKNMAFGCGHQTCQTCGDTLATCPICRMEISTRLRLY